MIKLKTKNFICLSVNPLGCKNNIKNNLNYIKNLNIKIEKKKNVLILGSSSGYGLLSSLFLGYKKKYNIINIFNEKSPSKKSFGTPGWYNSFFAEKFLGNFTYFKNLNYDIFSYNSITEVIKIIKNDLQKIDYFIYSIASSKYINVFNNKIYKSILKPIKKNIIIKDLNLEKNKIKKIEIKKASILEIENTKKVMGGFFWHLWVENLIKEDVVNKGFKTIAYSYNSSYSTKKIYKNGTIGIAKNHLFKTSKYLNKLLKTKEGRSFIVFGEAIITQSSVAIPGVSLYLSILNEFKKNNLDKNSLDNISDLFIFINKKKNSEFYFNCLENNSRIQKNISNIIKKINSKNFNQFFNIHEFKNEYFKIYGY